MKYQSTSKLAKVADEKYSFRDFLVKGKISHSVNIICALFWMLILSDIIQLYPKIYLFLTFLSGVVGYCNSSVVIKIFGVGQKYILEKVDHITSEDKKK